MTAYPNPNTDRAFTTQPGPMYREFCLNAITAHRSYFDRARVLLWDAQTADECAQARAWVANAETEIARWLAALEACEC